MVISKKIFRQCGASRGQIAFKTKYFFVILFHYFLVPFADTISTEPMPEIFSSI